MLDRGPSFSPSKGSETSIPSYPNISPAKSVSSNGKCGDEILKKVEHLQPMNVKQHWTKDKEPKFYACVSIPCLCSVVIALGLAKARERRSRVKN